MQFSIFHSIAESSINNLVRLLNDGRKEKEQYKLISVDDLPDNLILLTVTDHKEFLINTVDHNGNIPDGYTVNWRTVSHVIQEYGNKIPEILVRIRITELNKQMLDKGQSWDQIERFWNNIFKEVKK